MTLICDDIKFKVHFFSTLKKNAQIVFDGTLILFPPFSFISSVRIETPFHRKAHPGLLVDHFFRGYGVDFYRRIVSPRGLAF